MNFRQVTLLLRVIRGYREDTGELVMEKKEKVSDLINEAGYKLPWNKASARMFSEVSFPSEMSDAEIGKMARLAKLMIADSNMLGYRTRKGIKPYTEEELVELLGLSPRRGKEFLEKMIRLKVMAVIERHIGELRVREFYINPAYFFSGTRISLNLYLLFRESLDSLLPSWVRVVFWNMAQEKHTPVHTRGGVLDTLEGGSLK